MLHSIVDNIADFFGSSFRSNKHPIIYLFIRGMIFTFLILLLGIASAVSKGGFNSEVYFKINTLNAFIIGMTGSLVISIFNKLVDIVDGFFNK